MNDTTHERIISAIRSGLGLANERLSMAIDKNERQWLKHAIESLERAASSAKEAKHRANERLRTVRVTLEITHDITWVNPEDWDWIEQLTEGHATKPKPESLTIKVIDSEEVQP